MNHEIADFLFSFFFDTSRSAFPADSPASGVLKRHVLRQIWSHQGESMYSQYGLEGKDVSVMHNGSFSAEVFHFLRIQLDDLDDSMAVHL